MRLIVTASLQLVTSLCVYAQAQNARVFTFSDRPGPYTVGLKVVEQYDFSRTFDAYLKHDAAALNYLKKTPAENGIPKHVMAAHFSPRS